MDPPTNKKEQQCEGSLQFSKHQLVLEALAKPNQTKAPKTLPRHKCSNGVFRFPSVAQKSHLDYETLPLLSAGSSCEVVLIPTSHMGQLRLRKATQVEDGRAGVQTQPGASPKPKFFS